MSIKILLVDDHQVLRKGLKTVLEQQADFTVVGEAADSVSALTCLQNTAPDLVIMDIHMPGKDGIQISKQILATFPHIRIIILSAFADLPLVHDALESGVLGYVLKLSSPKEIVRAVRMATEGRVYLSPEIDVGVLNNYRKMVIGNPVQPSES